jgi:uncharacterized protein
VSTPARSSPQALRLLVVQPTPFCNIDCAYCYLGSRNSKKRMSVETLDRAVSLIFGYPWLERQIDVAWHAGEPLVVPLAWYEAAMPVVERRCPPGVEVRHRFQTNGLLVNRDWARFFGRTGSKVGLSIDGPAELHDYNRRTRRGLGTHAAVMRAVSLLHEEQIPFHVITVLTEKTLARPDDLFDFYVRNGIAEVGFNIEEIEGSHLGSSLSGDGIEPKFRSFIRRFFDLVLESPGLVKLRELEGAIGVILLNEPALDEQNVPFAVVSVSVDGDISTFSPELLGARHERFGGGFGFERTSAKCLTDCENHPRFRAVADEIRRGVDLCERTCRYFRWCGGGVPANKLFETGRFDIAETMHCRLTRQIVFDEALLSLERMLSHSRSEGVILQ